MKFYAISDSEMRSVESTTLKTSVWFALAGTCVGQAFALWITGNSLEGDPTAFQEWLFYAVPLWLLVIALVFLLVALFERNQRVQVFNSIRRESGEDEEVRIFASLFSSGKTSPEP